MKTQFFIIARIATCFYVALLTASCSKKSVGNVVVPPVIIPTDTTTQYLLALGDSYTIGQNVSEASRFPNQTIDILNSNGLHVKYPADIVATTGWTTQNLLNGIANATPTLRTKYDAVTLLIGVNNQYQHRDTAEYRTQFSECLNKAIAFAGYRKNRVFVLSIPDYGATPFGSSNARQIAIEIDYFNAINKDVCTAMNISYTDITPSTRLAANDNTLIASDGLHPSGKEYYVWANLLAPKIYQVLK